VERELFALEVRRLQRCVFHLGNLHKKVSDDNKEAIRLKVKISALTAKNPQLETSVSVSLTHAVIPKLIIDTDCIPKQEAVYMLALSLTWFPSKVKQRWTCRCNVRASEIWQRKQQSGRSREKQPGRHVQEITRDSRVYKRSRNPSWMSYSKRSLRKQN
jgi:hypothetical protein